MDLVTKNFFRQLFVDKDDVAKRPASFTVQALKFRVLAGEDSSDKVRIYMSDTDTYVSGIYTLKPGETFTEARLPVGALIKVDEYDVYVMNGKPVVMVYNWALSVVTKERLGDPKALTMEDVEAHRKANVKPEPVAAAAAAPTPAAPSAPSAPSATKSKATKDKRAVMAIEGLSPYTARWTIRAAVVLKGDLRTYNSQKGPGKLFNVTFRDETGEIRATAFNESADKFHAMLQEDGVYHVSNMSVRIANKQFNTVNHEYELIFDRDTQIEPVTDKVDLPAITFSFVELGDLTKIANNGTADIIGVVKEVDDVSQITSKSSGRPFDKRDLSLVDKSGFAVRTTLWGKQATDFDRSHVGSVVTIRAAKVSDFNGRSLSVSSSSRIQINPDIPDAHALKGWFDSQGSSSRFESLRSADGAGAGAGRNTPRYTLQGAQASNLGMSEKTDYFQVRATTMLVRRSGMTYPSCPDCRKKLIEETNSQWRCEKCDKTFPEPTHRYLLSVLLGDYTGEHWISCFDEVGVVIMGQSANDFYAEITANDDRLQTLIRDASMKEYLFTIRATLNTFEDNTGVRYQAVAAVPVDPVAESRLLLEKIKLY